MFACLPMGRGCSSCSSVVSAADVSCAMMDPTSSSGSDGTASAPALAPAPAPRPRPRPRPRFGMSRRARCLGRFVRPRFTNDLPHKVVVVRRLQQTVAFQVTPDFDRPLLCPPEPCAPYSGSSGYKKTDDPNISVGTTPRTERERTRSIEMQYVQPTVIHVTPSKSAWGSPQRVAGFSEKPVQVQPTLSPTESNSSLSTTATIEHRTSESSDVGSPSSFCTPGSSALEGWLFKKHAHAQVLGSQWARRCGAAL